MVGNIISLYVHCINHSECTSVYVWIESLSNNHKSNYSGVLHDFMKEILHKYTHGDREQNMRIK